MMPAPTHTFGRIAMMFFSLLLVLLLDSPAYGQQSGAATPQRAEIIYEEWMERMPAADPTDNLRQLDSLYAYLQAQKDTCRMAHALSWRTYIHDNTGKLDSAMQYINAARAMMRDCDSLIYMSIQVNYSGVLLSLDDIDKSIAVCSTAIAAWNHNWPYSRSLDGLYTNLAIGYAMSGDIEKAIATFREQLTNAEQENIFEHRLRAIGNLGAAYGILHNQTNNVAYLDSTEYYLELALLLEKEVGTIDGMITQYCNLARLKRDSQQFKSALNLLDSTYMLATDLASRKQLRDVAILRSECFRGLGQLDSAYYYLQEYTVHNDSILNQEKVRALVDM